MEIPIIVGTDLSGSKSLSFWGIKPSYLSNILYKYQNNFLVWILTKSNLGAISVGDGRLRNNSSGTFVFGFIIYIFTSIPQPVTGKKN